jgi:hypothetical protein
MLNQRLFLPLLVFIASTTYLNAQDQSYVAFSLRPGYNWDRMQPTGKDVRHLRFPTSARPTLSVAMDIDGAELCNFFIRADLFFHGFSFRAGGIDSAETYELKTFMIDPEFSLMYRVPSKWKLQGYIGAGFGLIWDNNDINEWKHRPPTNDVKGDFIALDYMPVALLLHAGAMYNKRVDLNCKFRWVQWAGGEVPNQRLIGKSINLSLSYRFFEYAKKSS